MTAQGVTAELFYDSTWHDLTGADEVFTAPIVIQRGQGDESKAPRPCSISMQLDNRTDKFRPSNPESVLYGKAGRNTPTRVKVGSSVRGVAEAASWEPDQTQDFRETPPRGKAWTDLRAGGLLERINGWTVPLRSPFYTFNAGLTGLTGYWPMEDPRGAVKATTLIDGADNYLLRGTKFDSQKRPPGSGPLADVELEDASAFRFARGDSASTVGWQFSFVVNMNGLSNTAFTPIQLSLANGYDISLVLDDSTNDATLVVFNATGGTAGSSTVNWGSYQWSGRWIMMVVKATYSAGTTTIGLGYRAAEDGFWTGFTTNFTGVPSVPDIGFGQGLPEGSTFGHYLVAVGGPDDLESDDRFEAFLGHTGERASYRFARLCDQFNIPYYVGAEFAGSAPMGAQPVATLAQLFEEIAQTDDGLIFDHREEIRLKYLSRADRYRKTPSITLTPTDFPALPKEVTDNQGVHNIVTVSQQAGGDYTVSDDTGPLGTQSPPDGVGEARQTVDVNVSDEASQLPQEANWWLRRGTVDLPRFPSLTLDLSALPGLVSEVESADIGDVIEINGFRENTIRLHILGYTERIGTHSRTITFVCRPDQQFYVGEYDATDARYDLRSSTMNASTAAGVTALTVKQTLDETWSFAGGYDLFIAGERVTVTSATFRSGTGPWTQPLTVVRGVNGINKTLPAGAEVHVATPGRWAL